MQLLQQHPQQPPMKFNQNTRALVGSPIHQYHKYSSRPLQRPRAASSSSMLNQESTGKNFNFTKKMFHESKSKKIIFFFRSSSATTPIKSFQCSSPWRFFSSLPTFARGQPQPSNVEFT